MTIKDKQKLDEQTRTVLALAELERRGQIEQYGNTSALFGGQIYDIPKMIRDWDSIEETKDKDELISEEWLRLKRTYYSHLRWCYKYPSRYFFQQYISAWILTGLVVILVLSGIGFSVYQLIRAVELGDVSNLHTEIAIETAGKLSISSTIVGAIVLIISLVFFYLYLRHVFGKRQAVPPVMTWINPDINHLKDDIPATTEEDTDTKT